MSTIMTMAIIMILDTGNKKQEQQPSSYHRQMRDQWFRIKISATGGTEKSTATAVGLFDRLLGRATLVGPKP